MDEGSASNWTWINAAAVDFERAWKAGSRPRIEDFLAESAEPRRAALLDKLVRVELEMRQRASEQPGPLEYRKRFPKYHAVIDAVFSADPDQSGKKMGPTSRPRATGTAGARARSQADAIPQELAENPDYEIIQRLGGGGMGLVFLAHNHIMGRDEVLKVISREIIETPGVLERFLREIRAVASLQHPNIVTAYSAFRAGDNLVFAMEYAEGLDLARMVKAKGPMPVGHACSFIYQAAMGLQHAHEAGMVHRDINPNNLVLTHEGGRAIVKVLDFGLAKATSEQTAAELETVDSRPEMGAKPGLTRTGWMLGTPTYIAPEQIVNAQKADIRADIYSLGCTLYYLLAGRPPFDQATVYDTLKAHRSTDAQLLNLVRPEVPPELAALVAKMMAKKPAERFQTPAEVANALLPFFKKSSIAGGTDLGANPAAQPGSGPAAGQAAGADWRSGNPIEIEETDDEAAEAATQASADRKQTRWHQAALAGALGFVAIACAAIVSYTWVASVRREPQPQEHSAADSKTTEPALLSGGMASDLALEAARVAGADDGSRPSASDVASKEGNEPALTSADATPTTAATPEATKTQSSEPKQAAATPPAGALEPGRTQSGVMAEKPRTPRRADWVPIAATEPRPSAFQEQVERAIHDGVRFLKSSQHDDGSWTDFEASAKTGTTSLVTLALLTAGEKPDSPAMIKALDHLRGFRADDLNSTYAIALQTLVFVAALPEQDRSRIAANVAWLERAQIKRGDPMPWPGAWTYSAGRKHMGDNSNTQYAVLALNAAREIGVRVKPEVWALARSYWENGQRQDGSWAYTPVATVPTASMTCAGISSLILTRRWSLPPRGQELLHGSTIRDCGKVRADRNVQGGIDWLSGHFEVGQNTGWGKQWKFYYLSGLERAGRLSGTRFFGQNDWFRLDAADLLREQDKTSGFWKGVIVEADKTLATTFAVLFLAKGRAPVLINKLNHAPLNDWNNDPDDVGNLVDLVSRERKHLLTWQVVDSRTATLADLLRAPILFFNGHKAPEFTPHEKTNLREYVERGGIILAEACCSHFEFDRGFRAMMTSVFPESELRPLPQDHPIWRAKHQLNSRIHSLWGIEQGGRTSVVYSPRDLSCYWNQANQDPANRAVIEAIKVGQNMVEYVTGLKRLDSAR